MLLKRRRPPSWMESFRVWIWPRRSWLRSGRYVTKRILRLTATPHAVASGVAIGAFTSFSPFMGLHFILAFILAWFARGNLLASALGTFVGNPITFPFIWAATYQTGHYVLHAEDVSGTPHLGIAMGNVLEAVFDLDGRAALEALDLIWEPLLFPMAIGGLIIGSLCAIPLYFITRRAAVLFRENRRNKLIAKASQIRERARGISAGGDMARDANTS